MAAKYAARPVAAAATGTPPGLDSGDAAITHDPRAHSRRATVIVVVAIVLALLPVIAVVVTRSWHHYLPLGDESSIDLRVRDVFSADPPLVGAYSRGFNHPGPLLFWLLAPFSAVAGTAAWGTLVGAAVLQGIAIGLSGWLAYRRGGTLLALLVLAAIGLAYSALTLGSVYLQPWNPNVAFPFFMLFLLQCWRLAMGDRWQLLGVAVTGSLVVQFHIGSLLLVGLGIVWALVVVFVDHRRDAQAGVATVNGAPTTSWRTVGVSAIAALVVLWIAPLVQQLADSPGNLTAVWDYFRNAGNQVAGLRMGAGVFAAEFQPPPPWLGGSDRLEFATNHVIPSSIWWLLVPAFLLMLGFVAARAAHSRAANHMVQLAALMCMGAIVAISRVSVEVQPFLFYWRVIIAVFVVVATLWAISRWYQLEDHQTVRRVAVVVLLLTIAGFSIARVADVLDHTDELGPLESSAQQLFDRAAPAASHGDSILVRGVGSTTNGLAQGLVDQLARDDVDVRVDPQYGYQYGAQRTAEQSDVDQVWYVSPYGANRALADRSGGRLIASVTPLSPTKERELQRLQAAIRDQLRGIGRTDLLEYVDNSFFGGIARKEHLDVDLDAADRIAELVGEVNDSGGCRCMIVAFPADQAPDIRTSMGF